MTEASLVLRPLIATAFFVARRRSGSAQLVLRLGLSRDWPLSTALGQRRAGVLAVLVRDFNLLGTTPRVSNA